MNAQVCHFGAAQVDDHATRAGTLSTDELA